MKDILVINRDLAELALTLHSKYTRESFADQLDQTTMSKVEVHLKFIETATSGIYQAINEMENEYRG